LALKLPQNPRWTCRRLHGGISLTTVSAVRNLNAVSVCTPFMKIISHTS
jgi:hypothetical protein